MRDLLEKMITEIIIAIPKIKEFIYVEENTSN
jgi:hypothetical protein